MTKKSMLVLLAMASVPVWAVLDHPTLIAKATETPSVILSLERGTPVQGDTFHHFKIYRRLVEAGGCGMDADDVQATPRSLPWTDTHVFDYYHYAYQVTAVATDGSESARSNCVIVKIP
ncbi:MAG: hypothetical protein DMG75_12320 [Acidobacteria bacterium]|nr:MAG: hypothetical protein DMG75_12320 [Acidobacteriota bacterium]